jgi:hypothetical protein
MGVLGSVWSAIKRGIGHVGNVAKTIGNFVSTHHQPLSLVAKAVGDASGVPLLQNIGNTAAAMSGLATMRNIGKDYGVRTGQKFPTLSEWKM